MARRLPRGSAMDVNRAPNARRLLARLLYELG